jgi:hypothetical protein
VSSGHRTRVAFPTAGAFWRSAVRLDVPGRAECAFTELLTLYSPIVVIESKL